MLPLKDRRRRGCGPKRLRSDRYMLSLFGGEGRSPTRRTLTPPGLLPLERSRRAPLSATFLRSGFFSPDGPGVFRGERERGGGGGAGLSGGASHRGAPAGPRGPSSHQRSATSCRRSQALFKKYFPSGTPPASSGPHPRSRAEEHPASPAGLEETASLADSKPSRGQVDPNPPPPSGDP